MRAIAFLGSLLLFSSSPVQADEDFRDFREMGGVVRIGRDVSIPRDTIADGPIVIIAGNAEILGDVDDDVVVIGGKLKLDSKVEGNVVAIGPDAELGPNADVIQNLVTIGTDVLSDTGSTIRGQTVNLHGFGMGILASLVGMLGMLAGVVLWFKLFSAFGWLLLAALAALFTPRTLEGTARAFNNRPGFSLLAAVLIAPSLFLLSLALTVSIVGLPIVPLLWVFVAVILIWGTIATGLWLGKVTMGALGKEGKDTWQPALVGMLLLQLILFVPVLGKGAFLLASGVGAGATVVAILGSLKRRF